MRGEPRKVRLHRAQPPLSPAEAATGAEGGRAALGAARRAAWAPILLRVAAGGLALVGLAGIGLAARKAPELAAPASPSSVGLAQLSGSISAQSAAADVARAVAAERPAASSPPATAASEAVPERPPSAAPPVPVERPCPELAASPAALPSPSPAAPSSVSAVAAAPLVDLNSADARQLQRLPGVGAKRAQAIIELRQRLGGFRSAADLLRIRGIGRRTLARMQPLLV